MLENFEFYEEILATVDQIKVSNIPPKT